MPKKNSKKQPVPVPQPQANPGETAAPSVSAQQGAERLTAGPEAITAAPSEYRKSWLPVALSVFYFVISLLSGETTLKPVIIALIFGTIVLCLPRLSTLGKRLTLPSLAVSLWVLLNGASTLYGISGMFALREFLRIMAGFCLFLLILAWSEKSAGKGRMAASMLEGGTALASIISIDMISTHLLSGPLSGFLSVFTTNYQYAFSTPLEVGTRLNSLYENPNVYAGIAGLGVLLGLEMAITSEEKKERRFHLVCLFLNALTFLLVFSMGASAMIALAFLVFLFLERPRRRGHLLVLMVETFVLVVVMVIPIYLFAFHAWSGFQPVPLLCAAAGAALLCGADQFAGQALSLRLEHAGKRVAVLILAILVLLAGYGALALNVTGAITVRGGEYIRRAAYLEPGIYTMEVDASQPARLLIQSQNEQETMMHSATGLYDGQLENVTFTVPENSKVVYFYFFPGEDTVVRSATYSGVSDGSLKLRYTLLPGFIANRLQGLFANENAVQRAVFFADGLKIFRESPVIGQGLGAFENSYRHVQSFYYATRYVHNHYIETLISTGVVGLVLFVGMLVLFALAILKNLRRGEEADPLAPCLGAALVFMAGHAGVEVIFSNNHYLLMAISVFGLVCVCCGDELPFLPEKEKAHTGIAVALAALIGIFGVTVYLNIYAESLVVNSGSQESVYRNLETAAKIDLYEWMDFELSYIYMAKDLEPEENWPVYTKAAQYAEHLSKQTSNTVGPYLAEYYFSTGQNEKAFAALDKHVTYLASYDDAWQTAFNVLAKYSEYTPEFVEEVRKLNQWYQDWNANNMGMLTLTDFNQVYIESMLMEL